MILKGGKEVLQTSNKDRKTGLLSKRRDGWVHGRIKGRCLGEGQKADRVWERGKESQCLYSPQSFLMAPKWCIHSPVCLPAACQNCGESAEVHARWVLKQKQTHCRDDTDVRVPAETDAVNHICPPTDAPLRLQANEFATAVLCWPETNLIQLLYTHTSHTSQKQVGCRRCSDSVS